MEDLLSIWSHNNILIVPFLISSSLSQTFLRCLFDLIPYPAGAGRNASAAAPVCHWPASQERECGSVEGHRPLSDGTLSLKQNKTKMDDSFHVALSVAVLQV